MSTSSEGSKILYLSNHHSLNYWENGYKRSGQRFRGPLGWTLYAFPNYCSYDSSRLPSTQQTIPEVVAFLPLVY